MNTATDIDNRNKDEMLAMLEVENRVLRAQRDVLAKRIEEMSQVIEELRQALGII